MSYDRFVNVRECKQERSKLRKLYRELQDKLDRNDDSLGACERREIGSQWHGRSAIRSVTDRTTEVF